MVSLDQPVFVARPPSQAVLQSLQWDAVDLLVRAAAINYVRIVREGAEHTRLNTAGDRDAANLLISILHSDALAFIGNIERLRKLVGRLGGGPDVRLAKRAFLATVNQYQDARDHIEHLDKALRNLVGTSDQAVMAMAWQTPNPAGPGVTFTFSLPGSARLGPGGPALRVTPLVRAPADHFTVRIAGADYNLTIAHDALQAFWERMQAWSEQWLPPVAPEA